MGWTIFSTGYDGSIQTCLSVGTSLCFGVSWECDTEYRRLVLWLGPLAFVVGFPTSYWRSA